MVKVKQIFSEEIKEKYKTLEIRKKTLKTTSSETKMADLLAQLVPKMGKMMPQKGFIAGNGFCICDFYNPRYRLCIEVDGGYHFTPEQKRKDWYKNRYLTQERKLRVYRIRNEEVSEMTPEILYRAFKNCAMGTVTYSPRYFSQN